MRLIDTPNGPRAAGNPDDDALLRYAGSLDGGATDAEYSPVLYPARAEGLCAADERHAALERRVAALERTLADGLTAAYLLGAADTRALLEPLRIQITSVREGAATCAEDTARTLAQHAAEIEALRTLLDRLLRESRAA